MMGVCAVGWMWLRLAKAALPDAGRPLLRCEVGDCAALCTADTLPQVAMLRQKVEVELRCLWRFPLRNSCAAEAKLVSGPTVEQPTRIVFPAQERQMLQRVWGEAFC